MTGSPTQSCQSAGLGKLKELLRDLFVAKGFRFNTVCVCLRPVNGPGTY